MSMRILFGGNEFLDCASVVAVRGKPLLRVKASPFQVSLVTPAGWDDAQAIAVEDGVARLLPPGARVIAGESAVVILVAEIPVVIAVADPAAPGTVLLRADLRPIGIDLHDDAKGLHVGGSTFTRVRVSNAAAAVSLA